MTYSMPSSLHGTTQFNIPDTAEEMLYEVLRRMAEVCSFKTTYNSQLVDLKPKFDNHFEAHKFIADCKHMLTFCEEADKHLDEYTEWLFDNTPDMPEGEYVKQMDICKKLKEILVKNRDYQYIEHQLAIACNVMVNLSKKMEKMKEKKKKKEQKKPVVWDKLEVFIHMVMKHEPDAPIEDFYDQLQYISYSQVNVAFNGNVKYVRDIGGAMYNQTKI
jgi:hypothetical protein